MEPVQVAADSTDDAATTASRNTSPSLPEDAHLFEGEAALATLTSAAAGDVGAENNGSTDKGVA